MAVKSFVEIKMLCCKSGEKLLFEIHQGRISLNVNTRKHTEAKAVKGSVTWAGSCSLFKIPASFPITSGSKERPLDHTK